MTRVTVIAWALVLRTFLGNLALEAVEPAPATGSDGRELAITIETLSRAGVDAEQHTCIDVTGNSHAPVKINEFTVTVRRLSLSEDTLASLRRLPEITSLFIEPIGGKRVANDVVWLKRFTLLRHLSARGQMLDSSLLAYTRQCDYLDDIELQGMRIAGRDIRFLKGMKHLGSIMLRDCELDGSVLKTLSEIGFSGELSVEYRGPIRGEKEYLEKSGRQLKFSVVEFEPWEIDGKPEGK